MACLFSLAVTSKTLRLQTQITINHTKVLKKTPEIAKELKAQPTIDDQFALLYRTFDYTLDRSDSLTGRDENKDGIRDDIEAFINALEVSEPVRDALKQNARYSQKKSILRLE